jgi:hypothetical protein
MDELDMTIKTEIVENVGTGETKRIYHIYLFNLFVTVNVTAI